MKKLYVTLTLLCRFLCIFLRGRGRRIFKIFLSNIFFLSLNESVSHFYCCFKFGVIFLYKGAFKYYVSMFGGVGGLVRNADTADAGEGGGGGLQ